MHEFILNFSFVCLYVVFRVCVCVCSLAFEHNRFLNLINPTTPTPRQQVATAQDTRWIWIFMHVSCCCCCCMFSAGLKTCSGQLCKMSSSRNPYVYGNKFSVSVSKLRFSTNSWVLVLFYGEFVAWLNEENNQKWCLPLFPEPIANSRTA